MIKMSFYDILGCDRSSSQDDLKKAYQHLILIHHPDKTSNNSSDFYIEIDKAWKTLRDPELRKIYDAEMMQKKFNENPLVFDVLEKSDFCFDEENCIYFYMCRCGGVYYMPDDVPIDEDCYVSCDECSLVIQIKF